MCFTAIDSGCFDLKTGCKVIGIFDLILAIYYITNASIKLANDSSENGLWECIFGSILDICAVLFLFHGLLKVILNLSIQTITVS